MKPTKLISIPAHFFTKVGAEKRRHDLLYEESDGLNLTPESVTSTSIIYSID